MDNDLLKQIEENTKATKNATKAIASFFIYSSVLVLVAIVVGVVAYLMSFNFALAQIIAVVFVAIGQIFVITHSASLLGKA